MDNYVAPGRSRPGVPMKDLQIKKLYYSISEVSRMVGLEPYVLRYWETEFEQLRPQKNRAGNRIYTEKDIETIRLIKKLTREKRYTIEGARQIIGQMSESDAVDLEPGPQESEVDPVRRVLLAVRTALLELRMRLGLSQQPQDESA